MCSIVYLREKKVGINRTDMFDDILRDKHIILFIQSTLQKKFLSFVENIGKFFCIWKVSEVVETQNRV